MSEPSFDPRQYKETTREQWQTAAEAWHRWGPTLERWLGEATEEMLVLADALKPGGRFAGIVFSTPDRSPFFSLPVSIIRRRAELPAPAPGLPGPFSVGGEGVLGDELAEAGFVEIEVRRVEAPVRLSSAAECVRFEQESFGALHQMLAGLDDDGRAAAWAEIAETLAQFEGADGFTGPCELLVGAGTRP
ncbi:MAG: hypothetical protein ACXVZ3_02665 [Gaiellaceae bacterium]